MRRIDSRSKTVGVIGPGAVGSLLAARLSRAGLPVLLVGRSSAWLSQARRNGIALEENAASGKTKTFRPRRLRFAVRPEAEPCDAVFVCVKSHDTPAALRRMRPMIGENTAVVGLQNGLTHRKAMMAAFGSRRTAFGVSYAAVERLSPVRVRHHGGTAIALAARGDNNVAAAKARRLLSAAGFRVEMRSNEDQLLWTKAAFNAATNPIGALSNHANGQLIRIPALRELVFRAAKEAAAAARANGIRIVPSNLQRPLTLGLLAAPDQLNSMLQDVRAGRRTEADAILKPFLDAAKRRHVAVPLLESLHRMVRRLEQEVAR